MTKVEQVVTDGTFSKFLTINKFFKISKIFTTKIVFIRFQKFISFSCLFRINSTYFLNLRSDFFETGRRMETICFTEEKIKWKSTEQNQLFLACREVYRNQVASQRCLQKLGKQKLGNRTLSLTLSKLYRSCFYGSSSQEPARFYSSQVIP